MACFACMPDCDKCIPKFIACPDCSTRCMLSDASCARCGHAFSQTERQLAREQWLERLMSARAGGVRGAKTVNS